MHIGLIGVGNIGAPIAKRLLEFGHELTVCDVRDAALDEFRARGVSTTGNASDCARAEIVIVVVATGAQLQSALTGKQGLLAGVDSAKPCRLVVMSTVAPQTIRDLLPTLAQKNVRIVDAGVSGGVPGAERGTLSIVVGGDDETVAPLQAVFDCLGTTYRAGPTGAGMAAKIINNVLGVTNIFLMAEALQLLRPLGVTPEQVTQIMENSSGRNAGTRDLSGYRRAWGDMSADLTHMQSAIDISAKDLALALQLADVADVNTPLIAGLQQRFAALDAEQVQAIWSSFGTANDAVKGA